MEMRVCSKCDEKKVLAEAFRKSSVSKSGIQNYRTKCKKCYAEERKIRNSDPEVKKNIKQKFNAWAEKNKVSIAKRQAEYYKKNKKEITKKHKEWLNENADRVKKVSQEWKKDNRSKWLDYRSKYEREKRENDPLFNLIGRIRGRVNKAFINQGYAKQSKTSQMLGVDFEEVKAHIESQFINEMSWENRSDWQIDHIIPLASAESEEELVALAYYKNLQPLWTAENLSKNDDYNPEDKRKYLEWYEANVKKL